MLYNVVRCQKGGKERGRNSQNMHIEEFLTILNSPSNYAYLKEFEDCSTFCTVNSLKIIYVMVRTICLLFGQKILKHRKVQFVSQVFCF